MTNENEWRWNEMKMKNEMNRMNQMNEDDSSMKWIKMKPCNETK